MSYEVTTPGNPMEEFRKKILDKLKTDFGSMMPEEVLNGLVKQAVYEEFLKPRLVREDPNNSYNTRTVEKPSWFATAVAEAAKPLLQALLQKWVDEHEGEITKAFDEFIKDQHLMLLAFQLMLAKSHLLEQRLLNISNQLNNLGQR